MIDLDQPARYRTPPARTSGGGWQRVLILVVVAFVLGAAAMYFWRYRPLAASVERAESTVSVVLLAEPGTWTVHDEPRRVRIEAQVTVVNAGPATVDVRAVRADQPGVTVRSPERERPVPPGTAWPVDVVVEWNCAVARPAALVASVRVETADERIREIAPVAVHGAPWTDSGRAGCAG